MKKIFLVCTIGAMAFISCKKSNSPTEAGSNKEYSIVFCNADQIFHEQYALGAVNPDGTGLKKIGPGLASFVSFSISDNGLQAVYLNRVINNQYITVSNLSTMTDYQFSDIERAGNPIISPDGAYIVYRIVDSLGFFVMNIDGSNNKYLAVQTNPMFMKWSSDSKGIIYASEYSMPRIPKTAYYIDKDGTNAPVEVQSPFMQYGIADLEYYSMNQFTRAGLSGVPDSVGFAPLQFNKQKKTKPGIS